MRAAVVYTGASGGKFVSRSDASANINSVVNLVLLLSDALQVWRFYF